MTLWATLTGMTWWQVILLIVVVGLVVEAWIDAIGKARRPHVPKPEGQGGRCDD